MPNPIINWVNDHTQICDRFNKRVQLMEHYLNSKPEDFDGFTAKRFLLSQARERCLGTGNLLRHSILSAVSSAVAPWKLDRPI